MAQDARVVGRSMRSACGRKIFKTFFCSFLLFAQVHMRYVSCAFILSQSLLIRLSSDPIHLCFLQDISTEGWLMKQNPRSHHISRHPLCSADTAQFLSSNAVLDHRGTARRPKRGWCRALNLSYTRSACRTEYRSIIWSHSREPTYE